MPDFRDLPYRSGPSASSTGGLRMIVGVDYGTTYTGVAFVPSDRKNIDDITVINTWPGPGKIGDGQWKTPSRIAYAAENADIKTDQIGYEVTPKMKAYSWTKLLLDGKTKPTEFDDPNLSSGDDGLLKLPKGKSAGTVAKDYLKLIYQHTVKHLEKVLSPEILKVTPLDFYFTVPAIWSDAAKAATMTAAKSAGFASNPSDNLYLVPEPEAAGVATLKHLTHKGSKLQINTGDGVLICDCGGGTVDITTYKITSIDPDLSFEELVIGNGGKCGSTYIDRRFHSWMRETFGNAFDKLKFEKKGPGSKFMKEFEVHKRDFDISKGADQKYEVELVMLDAPDGKHYDADESQVKFTGVEMLSFFKPVVNTITDMLNEQVVLSQKARGGVKINRVILVGGFGDSPYLNSVVRKWCDAKGMRLVCPEHPQAAIVKGAALRGLERLVPTKRLLRKHYGFVWSAHFREGIDSESDAWYDKWDGTKYCNGIMNWQIAKGQGVDDKTRIAHEVFLCLDEFDDEESITSHERSLELFSCSSDTAPERLSDRNVVSVGKILLKFREKDVRKFKSKTDRYGRFLVEAQYSVEVMMASMEGILKFRATVGGVEIGSATIVYSTD